MYGADDAKKALIERFSPRIALATAVAVLLAGSLVTVYNENLYRTQKIDEVSALADILASSVTAALLFKDRPAAQEYVDALSVNPEIRLAAVYGAEGDIFASYARDDDMILPDSIDAPRSSFEEDRKSVV